MVYDYAMWISAAFKVKVIRAYQAMERQPQAKAPSDPGMSEQLRATIDRKALSLALQDYDRVRAVLAECARQFLRHGDSEIQVMARLDQSPVGSMRLVRSEDLLPLGATLANLVNAVNALAEPA